MFTLACGDTVGGVSASQRSVSIPHFSECVFVCACCIALIRLIELIYTCFYPEAVTQHPSAPQHSPEVVKALTQCDIIHLTHLHFTVMQWNLQLPLSLLLLQNRLKAIVDGFIVLFFLFR